MLLRYTSKLVLENIVWQMQLNQKFVLDRVRSVRFREICGALECIFLKHETYSESCQTYKTELFAKIINGF